MPQIWSRSLLHALMMSGAAALAEPTALPGQPPVQAPLAGWQDPAAEAAVPDKGFRAQAKAG